MCVFCLDVTPNTTTISAAVCLNSLIGGRRYLTRELSLSGGQSDLPGYPITPRQTALGRDHAVWSRQCTASRANWQITFYVTVYLEIPYTISIYMGGFRVGERVDSGEINDTDSRVPCGLVLIMLILHPCTLDMSMAVRTVLPTTIKLKLRIPVSEGN